MNISEYLENFLANFFNSGQGNLTAVQIQGAVTDAGYDPAEMDNVDWGQVYENACNHPGVPAEYKGAMQNYPAPTVHTVVREVQTINQTEINNTNIFDNSTTIDQSLTVGGDFSPSGDFDFNPVAADDGSAAAGNDQTGVAVGEGATASGSGDANNAAGGGLVNTGTNLGNQNTGDGAVQLGGTSLDLGFGGGVREPVLLREQGGEGGGFPFEQPGQDININTGSGHQTNVDGQGNLVNYGDGATNSNQNLVDNELDHSAVGGHDAEANDNSGVDLADLLGPREITEQPQFLAAEAPAFAPADEAADAADPADALDDAQFLAS